MTTPVISKSRRRPGGRADRRWLIAIPLLLAVLGGLAGVTAGTGTQASAVALLLVRYDANSGGTPEAAADNAAAQLSTRAVFNAAAEKTGDDPDQLQLRSSIAARPNSQIVSISVTALTSDQAVRDANAVAEAGVGLGPNQVPGAIAQLTQATRDLISSGQLGDNAAEKSRIARLGDELGASQAALVSNATQLQLLQSAEPNSPLPGRSTLGLMGALAGALVGVALALLIRVRRGTVKSARELAELYPHATVISSADLQEAFELEPSTRTVIVAGPRGEQLTAVTETIREALQATTSKSVVLADSLANIGVDESPNGHIDLVTTTLSETVLRRTNRDEGSVLIVPVRPKVTKLDAVDDFASRMSDRSYLLVDNKAPAWD